MIGARLLWCCSAPRQQLRHLACPTRCGGHPGGSAGRWYRAGLADNRPKASVLGLTNNRLGRACTSLVNILVRPVTDAFSLTRLVQAWPRRASRLAAAQASAQAVLSAPHAPRASGLGKPCRRGPPRPLLPPSGCGLLAPGPLLEARIAVASRSPCAEYSEKSRPNIPKIAVANRIPCAGRGGHPEGPGARAPLGRGPAGPLRAAW